MSTSAYREIHEAINMNFELNLDLSFDTKLTTIVDTIDRSKFLSQLFDCHHGWLSSRLRKKTGCPSTSPMSDIKTRQVSERAGSRLHDHLGAARQVALQ